MFSASFYYNGAEYGNICLGPLVPGYAHGEDREYFVEWTDFFLEGDVRTNVIRRDGDSVRDLFAMALVEVDAILAERAVN